MYFIDTSALVKFYFPEQGSSTVQEAFRRLDGSLSVSELVALEALGVFARERRKRTITGPAYVQARNDLLNDLRTRLYVVPLPESAFAEALGFTHTYRDRGIGCNDFLHLATAEYLQTLIPGETVSLMCSDRRFKQLAMERGFDTFDPETDDLNDLLPPTLPLQ